MTYIAWLALAVILFIFEAITVGLVCIWFSFGALGGFFVALFTDNIIIQIIVFVAVTLITFCTIKPIFKRVIPQRTSTNSTDRLIGRQGKITEAIKNGNGRVLVGDVSWIATSKEDIEKDALVKVVSAQGNTLTVERV